MDAITLNKQLKKTYQAFKEEPKTMLQVSIETGILRANICRYVKTFEQTNNIWLIKKGRCPVSKHRAGFYTTNPELVENVNQREGIYDGGK